MPSNTRNKSKEDRDNAPNADPQLQSLVKTLVSKVCTSQEFLENLTSMVVDTLKEHFENRIVSLEQQNENLKQQLVDYGKEIKTMNQKLDRFEQNSRVNCIRIYGFQGSGNNLTSDVIQFLGDKLQHTLQQSDIVDCYRLHSPNMNGDNKKPVIIKFRDVELKRRIYNSKSKLKGCKVTIREDLTYKRLKIVRDAIAALGHRNVWTREGIVFVRNEERIVKLVDEDMLQKLLSATSKTQ